MLYVVATPIGDSDEITLRALEVLKSAETIIVESTKESSKLLRQHGITGKTFEVLNEHSKPEDLNHLVNLCKTKTVALVSDCGTPVFSDPGSDLIARCRKNNVAIKSVLGASSLMGLLSLSSKKITQFLFRGFLPAESIEREIALKELKSEKRNIVLMDTPYRLKKILAELETHFSDREILLALNLSQSDEQVLEGPVSKVKSQIKHEKAEFMVMIYEVKK